jgi:pimeloyl-ACP methyl ester carboxylesterase
MKVVLLPPSAGRAHWEPELEVLSGRLEVFEGAGHLVSLDQTERSNRVLLDFLELTS